MPTDTVPAAAATAADDDWEPALRARMTQAGLDKYLDGPAPEPRIFPRESDLEFEARRKSLEAEQRRALWLLVTYIPDHVKACMRTMGWNMMMPDPFVVYNYARLAPSVLRLDDGGGGGGASNGTGIAAGSLSAVARPPSTASDRPDRPPAAMLTPKQQAPVAGTFSRSPLAVRLPSLYHNKQPRQQPTTTATFVRRSPAPPGPPAEPPPAAMRGRTPAHPDPPAPAGPPAKRPFLGRPKGWKPGMSYKQFRDDPVFAAAAAAAADARSRSTAKARPKNGTQPRTLANSAARAKRPAVEPVWYPYLCRWGKCGAELHNAETLGRHLRIVHCQPLIRAGRKLLHCDWKKCVRSAACQTPGELLGHVMKRHVRTMAARLGEGARNTITPRGSLGVAGEGEPLPGYLFYRDGSQVTPSVRDQPLEDAAAARERKKRLEAALRVLESESEDEDEDEEGDEDEDEDEDEEGDEDEDRSMVST